MRYDSSLSAGYRDVVLNLSVNTRHTRELLVSTHVCEVQLLLGEFAQMKVSVLGFTTAPSTGAIP